MGVRERGFLDYDRIVEVYDELYGSEQRLKYRLALEHVRLATGSLVLDLGCGTGLFAREAKGWLVVGLDLSRGMARRAKRRCFDVVVADACLCPFRRCAFDAVVSFTVVHEAPCLVEEAYRLVKPGGVIVVSVLRKCPEVLEEVKSKLHLPNLKIISSERAKDIVVVARRPGAKETLDPS